MLSDDDLERFARQVIMPAFGEDSQETLLASHVAVIGAGGLGAPLIQYLAAAGVGQLTIIDDDAVDRSNLNRQVIHATDAIGTAKAASASAAVSALNPGVAVNAITTRVDEDNIVELIGDAPVIADCSDTPRTRHAVNQAAHQLGRVMVFGGAVRMEGQISSFNSGRDNASPCFNCIFPAAAGHDLAPRCSEAGILGPITGTIGTLMALEVLRHCLKPAEPVGKDLVGRLLLYDGMLTEVTEIRIRKRADCPVCNGASGGNPG